MQIYGELGRTAWFPKCSGFLINSGLSGSYFSSKLLLHSRSLRIMKRQGLVVTARSLFSDRGPAFGFDSLPLIGVVFFHSSSLMGVVLFPSYAH